MATRTETRDESNLRMQRNLDIVDWNGIGCTEPLGERHTIEEVTLPEPVNVVIKDADDAKVKR